MSVIIEESGMQFGEYDENQVFRIEKCKQYSESLSKNGIKACEFILQRKNNLYFFEAKSSCPRCNAIENNPQKTREERKKAYDEFIEEIVLKMRHSISLYSSILLKRFPQDDVPIAITNPNLKGKCIKLVLVINTHGKWTPEPELADDLKLHLNDVMKIWRISHLLVINDQTAREKKFIL